MSLGYGVFIYYIPCTVVPQEICGVYRRSFSEKGTWHNNVELIAQLKLFALSVFFLQKNDQFFTITFLSITEQIAVFQNACFVTSMLYFSFFKSQKAFVKSIFFHAPFDLWSLVVLMNEN